MAELLQYVITGITVGMVYSLIALGFVLIWKSSGVSNLALGQMVLLFSWFAYGLLAQVGMPVWLGLICTVLLAMALGWLIERIVLRPLIAQPILSLITVTMGLSFFLQGVVYFIWPMSLASLPQIFPSDPVHIGSAVVSQQYLWAAAIALILFIGPSLYFKYSRTRRIICASYTI